MSKQSSVEGKVRDIRRKTRRKYTAEEKIRIVLEWLRGEKSISALCSREGIAPNLYYSWSKEFQEDQFHRVSPHNRILNVFTELSSGALESGSFKAAVSGDRINAAYKHRDVFEFRPVCKIAGTCNELPKVLDNSDGFFRKVLLIKHRKQFFGAERDPYLLDKLLEELPGIFSWAWVGLDRLRERGEFRASQASHKASVNTARKTTRCWLS